METCYPERSGVDDDYEPLGLTEDQIDRLATEVLEAICWSADSGRSAGALYFQHQLPAGDWLIQGLGQQPDGNDFLVYDFPQLDDSKIFFGQREAVYLPELCPPAAAKELVGRIFDDRQPNFRPLVNLTDLLRQPEANRVRYRGLTEAVNAGIDQNRARLAALGCQLPDRHPTPVRTELPDEEIGVNPIGPRMPADLAIIRLLETRWLILSVPQIVETLNAVLEDRLEPARAHSLLSKLSHQGLIQPVSRGHYAARRLNLESFVTHQLPGPLTDRTASLLEAHPKREWRGESVASSLNWAGSLLGATPVDPSQAQSCLQHLARQKEIKRIDPGAYASWKHPAPAYRAPLTASDEQIVGLLAQDPERAFTKREVLAELNLRAAEPVGFSHIRKGIPALVSLGLIKRTGPEHYASPGHPSPEYRPAGRPIAGQAQAVVNSQPERVWTPVAACRAINDQHPDQPPLTRQQAQSALAYLANQAGKIKAVKGGYASLDCRLPPRWSGPPIADRLEAMLNQSPEQDFSPARAAAELPRDGGPATDRGSAGRELRSLVKQGRARKAGYGRYASPARDQPKTTAHPPESGTRPKSKRPEPPTAAEQQAAWVAAPDPDWDEAPRTLWPATQSKSLPERRPSLGSRINPIVREWPELATPEEIADAVESDGRGPVNRQSVIEQAELVLKRYGKLAGPD